MVDVDVDTAQFLCLIQTFKCKSKWNFIENGIRLIRTQLSLIRQPNHNIIDIYSNVLTVYAELFPKLN
jgi:hypothetical protein